MRESLIEKWIEPNYINKYGTMIWYNKYGEFQSKGDNPAIIYLDGTKFWYKNGKYHRDGDKPSSIYSNGNKVWHKNGQYIKSSPKWKINY